MVAIYITSMSGWIMMVLLVVTAIYPFLLRLGVLGPVQPFLKRMRFHYWLGYIIATVAVIHAWLPMSARLAGVVNEGGLYLGTLALFLIFAQVMLGRRLSWPKLPIRRMLRRWHFWVMVGIGVFVLGHIILDSPTVQLFISRFTT